MAGGCSWTRNWLQFDNSYFKRIYQLTNQQQLNHPADGGKLMSKSRPQTRPSLPPYTPLAPPTARSVQSPHASAPDLDEDEDADDDHAAAALYSSGGSTGNDASLASSMITPRSTMWASSMAAQTPPGRLDTSSHASQRTGTLPPQTGSTTLPETTNTAAASSSSAAYGDDDRGLTARASARLKSSSAPLALGLATSSGPNSGALGMTHTSSSSSSSHIAGSAAVDDDGGGASGGKDDELLWLPTDWALFTCSEFRPYFLKYANSQAAFFEDYAEAHKKMSELGARWSPDHPAISLPRVDLAPYINN